MFVVIYKNTVMHGPSLLPDKAKFTVCSIIKLATIAFDETSSYWSAPKAPNFSAFHWSPHVCLITIGQHFVTTRVVHLPKRTETSLITESDQSRANHLLLKLCTVRTAWSESDQAVRAVHSCKSWFESSIGTGMCRPKASFFRPGSFHQTPLFENNRLQKTPIYRQLSLSAL